MPCPFSRVATMQDEVMDLTLTYLVPTVIPTQMNATTRTTTTTQDSFATGIHFTNRFSSTSSRRAPTAVDESALECLRSVVKAEALVRSTSG